MRIITSTVFAALAALILTGCASTTGPAPADPADPAADASLRDADSTVGADEPWDLVGLWRVSGAEGESADTWLRIGAQPDDLTLWRECGYQSGTWAAGGGSVLFDIYTAHEECVEGGQIPVVVWLADAVAYSATADGWALRAADGTVTARLTVDGAPPSHPDLSDDYREPPVIGAAEREKLTVTSPSTDAAPAAASDLVGRWVPEGPAVATDPHLVVEENGTWTGSDGCNGFGGRWASTTPGSLVSTIGASTLIGCEGSGAPAMFGQARSVALDGSTLVLFDAAGDEVARLVPAS